MSIYNPLDKFHKSIIGAVSSDREVTYRVKGDFDSVILLFKKDGEQSETSYQMENKGSCFEVTLKLSTGLYFYCFKLNDFNYIGLGKNYEGVVTSSPVKFQLTVFDGGFSVPKWLKGGIIYQIFPDRFCSFNKNKSIDKGKILHDNWLDTPCFLPDEKGKIKNTQEKR
jgi:hypothetical protein